MYDPTVGRWLQEDPIGFEGGDINLYRYVGNQPTLMTDPSGFFATYSNAASFWADELARGVFDLTIANVTGQPDRTRLLAGIPRLNPAAMPRIPAGWNFEKVEGGETKVGSVPQRTILGPAGCGPCTGLILIPRVRTLPTYAFHFGFIDNVSRTLNAFFHLRGTAGPTIVGGYTAVICGAEISSDEVISGESRYTLAAVIGYLRRLRVPITGYVPGPSAGVDENGTVYWTTSAETLTPNY